MNRSFARKQIWPRLLRIAADIFGGLFVFYFVAIALFIIVANPPLSADSASPLYARNMGAESALAAIALLRLIFRYSAAVTKRFPIIDEGWFKIALAGGVLAFCAIFAHRWS